MKRFVVGCAAIAAALGAVFTPTAAATPPDLYARCGFYKSTAPAQYGSYYIHCGDSWIWVKIQYKGKPAQESCFRPHEQRRLGDPDAVERAWYTRVAQTDGKKCLG
ncbi:hypothetical protein GCM10012275_50430 [Longimycelium tulufanense]|uniref:Secreted protein n=1 Tax=Longimycelium tulufanense TaxID=907463 RepID=A0A8J3CIZ0_9PSEU|nr:DUF6355 family natural product biosynthesis protein [Longimycelium tulufanense]GGM73623.1 hypothetical protein GCM10012275_50430 [Longimycelium tulufanense]